MPHADLYQLESYQPIQCPQCPASETWTLLPPQPSSTCSRRSWTDRWRATRATRPEWTCCKPPSTPKPRPTSTPQPPASQLQWPLGDYLDLHLRRCRAVVLQAPPVCRASHVLGAARWAVSGPRLNLPASSFSSWRSTSWASPLVRHRRYPRRYRRSCRQRSLPDQRSLAGTSSAMAAGATPPHGTMDRILSRTATRQRSHHLTARLQGGWAALRCPGRHVPSLHQEFELRSCHLLAPCRPSRGACASPSLWRGRGMSRWVAAKLHFDLWIAAPRC